MKAKILFEKKLHDTSLILEPETKDEDRMCEILSNMMSEAEYCPLPFRLIYRRRNWPSEGYQPEGEIDNKAPEGGGTGAIRPDKRRNHDNQTI